LIMTARKRHSPEQVVRKVTTADRLLAEGKDVAAVCRELGCPSRRITGGATSSAG
jgi:putative transposase